MALKTTQFRFFNNKASSLNQPSGISIQNLVSGNVFKDVLPITKLGIQALPGTKFYLNSGIHPIIIGATGIYDLDLNGISEITSISFNAESLSHIADSDTASLIIDLVYEKEE